jgi:hypothetical protein
MTRRLQVTTETGRYHGAALLGSLEPGLAMQLPRYFRPSSAAPSSDSGTPSAELEGWASGPV